MHHLQTLVLLVSLACRQDEHGADVELIAVSDVRSGEEATIAYTDRGGWALFWSPSLHALQSAMQLLNSVRY